MFGLTGNLLFRCVTGAKGHCYELADDAFLDAVAVEPRLFWSDDIVLWTALEAFRPLAAGNCV